MHLGSFYFCFSEVNKIFILGMILLARPSKYTNDRELKEDRKFECLIYESPELELKLNRLSYYWEKFYYIKHDHDVWLESDVIKWELKHNEKFPYEIGSPKKVHYHCIGYTYPIVLGLAATKFDVPSNQVQRVKNLKSSIRYLIHKDNPEKYQYSLEEIVTNDLDLESYFKDKVSATFKAKLLLEYIFSTDKCSFYSISHYAIQNDLWDELRRGQHLYSQLIAEHNRGVFHEN